MAWNADRISWSDGGSLGAAAVPATEEDGEELDVGAAGAVAEEEEGPASEGADWTQADILGEDESGELSVRGERRGGIRCGLKLTQKGIALLSCWECRGKGTRAVPRTGQGLGVEARGGAPE